LAYAGRDAKIQIDIDSELGDLTSIISEPSVVWPSPDGGGTAPVWPPYAGLDDIATLKLRQPG